jgi:hypothetical protein
MPLTKHNHVIEQLSTKGAYPAFRAAVLPRGFRRGAELFDTKVSDSRVEGPAVDCVAVANQTDHVGIGTDRLDDLLGGPRGVWVRRHVDMQDAPPLQREYEEYVQHVERHGRNREEVDRVGAGEMRPQECPPRHRRRPTGTLTRIVAPVTGESPPRIE